MADDASVRIRLLGGFEVTVAGRAVAAANTARQAGGPSPAAPPRPRSSSPAWHTDALIALTLWVAVTAATLALVPRRRGGKR